MNQFYLQNPNDHVAYFDDVYELYTANSTAVGRALYLNDSDHPSCMKVSCLKQNQGVYKAVSVLGNERHVIELAYRCSGTQKIMIRIYDQTNSATLYRTSVANTNWSNFYKRITTPATCQLLRLHIYQASTVVKAFYIDDVKIQGNALQADPDDYSPSFDDIFQDHILADGGKVTDRKGRNVTFNLSFPTMTASAFAKLRQGSRAGLATYFDDGNVPIVTESFILRATASKTYSGVTQGASSKAFYTATTATPLAVTNFQGVSFSNTDYTNIGTDDSNYVTESISGTGKYGYHKFKFRVSNFGSKLHIRKFSAIYKGLCLDSSANGVHGVNFYAWNGVAWVLVDRSRTQDKQTLAFETSKPEQAQQFVDTTNGFVRLLVQTRATKDVSANLALKSYYVEAKINEDLGYSENLLNKAIPTASGGIVSVKNLTSGSTLVLNQATTGYRLGDDRQKVIITSDEVSGSYIQIKYNQYYHVAMQSIRQPKVFGGNISQPRSAVDMVLKTVTPIEKV